MSDTKQKLKNERMVYYADYKPLNGRRNVYPVIRLGGKYLRQFGFEIGDPIDVTVENEQIIIKKIYKSEEHIREKELQNVRSAAEKTKDTSRTR